MSPEWLEVILEIGAEGGSIKVLALTNADGVTKYGVQLRDQSFQFLKENEAGEEIRRDSGLINTWGEAMEALGRWPWPMLYPIYVHPDYRQRVLMAAKQLRLAGGQPASASAIERWKKTCRPVGE